MNDNDAGLCCVENSFTGKKQQAPYYDWRRGTQSTLRSTMCTMLCLPAGRQVHRAPLRQPITGVRHYWEEL
jgi:hypothetical protein